MTRALSCFVLLALGAAHPAAARAADVLLVSDAGTDTEIASLLAADGHTVSTVVGDFASGNAALRGDLSPYQLVVWSATGSGYGDAHTDPSVFANLRTFVERGGRLLVTGYDSVASPYDPLLVELLGGGGSTDVPGPPGPIADVVCSLTTGLVDLRGRTPVPASGDRDTLTDLRDGTVAIVTTRGGGGAQWTLRRLGAGEIAYVSHGDAATYDTHAWSNAEVYALALRNFAFAAGAAHPTAAASPRRARVMYLLAAPAPAVLVGPDRAWIPPGTETPLSVCAGPACHPIRETRACQAPECPGVGTLLVASERLADVADFPRDRDGFLREQAALRYDAELSTLAWAFSSDVFAPVEPPRPTRFLRPRHDWLGWELHAEGGIGVLANAGVGVPYVAASFGIRFQPEMEEGLDVMYGTILGADLRATYVPRLDGQRDEDFALLLGVSPFFSYAFPEEAVRIPPAWAWFVPELGLALSSRHEPTWYAAWHLDAAILVDEHVGFDVRGNVTVIDDWAAGDDVEVLCSIGVGGFFR